VTQDMSHNIQNGITYQGADSVMKKEEYTLYPSSHIGLLFSLANKWIFDTHQAPNAI